MIYKKNKKINLLSFVYCMSMIVFLMFALSIITSKDGYKVETWQDYATFDFEQEVTTDTEGNEVVTNLISTPEQLAGFFAMQSNDSVFADDNATTYFTSSNSYKLKNNIDLNGKSWTLSENSRVLDGNYFTISNLKVENNGEYVGFVSKNCGTIKNLFFKNVTITNTRTDGAASGTGTVCGCNNGTIDSVVVLSGTIKGNTYSNNNDRKVGGVCGLNSGTVLFCTNYATVNRGKFIGGIAGYSNGGSITNCYNYGTISAPQKNQWPRLGGIVAENGSSSTLSLCANFGTVNASDVGSGIEISDIRLGGVVGHSWCSISKCANYGTVKGTSGSTKANASYAGGVIGYCTGTVSDCYNLGSVSGYAKQTTISKQVTDSLSQTEIGYYNYYGFLFFGHHESHFYRQVTFTSSKDYDIYAYTGGICGHCDSTVENCYSNGTIYGGYQYRKSKVNVHIWRTGDGASDANFNVESISITPYFDSICADAKSSIKGKNYYFGTFKSEKGTLKEMNDANKIDTGSYSSKVSWKGFDIDEHVEKPPFTNGITIEIKNSKLIITKGEYYDPPNVRGSNRPPYYKTVTDTSCTVANASGKKSLQGTELSPDSIDLSTAGWNTDIWDKNTINSGYPYLKEMFW